METSDILKKVRKIEIKTRGLSQNIFAGQYHSAFKGRGMAFSEVREYQYGDDVRDIDWNVTARFHRPYVKVFEEERELTVMLLVDVSGSLDFGTSRQLKREMVAEIAATLAFSAIQNNDKIGVILFSDRIEKYIPPKKGRKHILYVIREMLNYKPESKRTDIGMAVEFLTRVAKRRCTRSTRQHQQSPYYIKKNQTPQIETVERAASGRVPSSEKFAKPTSRSKATRPRQAPARDRPGCYSLSPAVIWVAESAPSAAVAAAASGQTQSVKAG